ISFHETKNLISGEGGALLLNSETLIERAEIVREKGTNRSKFFRGDVDKYTWVDIGSSFLSSDILAAFLWAQLEAAETIGSARQAPGGAARSLVQRPYLLPDPARCRGAPPIHRDAETRGDLRGVPLCTAAQLARRPEVRPRLRQHGRHRCDERKAGTAAALDRA